VPRRIPPHFRDFGIVFACPSSSRGADEPTVKSSTALLADILGLVCVCVRNKFRVIIEKVASGDFAESVTYRVADFLPSYVLIARATLAICFMLIVDARICYLVNQIYLLFN